MKETDLLTMHTKVRNFGRVNMFLFIISLAIFILANLLEPTDFKV